ncbi:MAG: NAD(P)H-hydrate epimerase [Lachnospiraceae bacterium]|nr:NAD(P)H-hydrate epimerase [Lachnospiraceae bacterium]
MIEVLSVANMRQSDARTIENGTSGRELMMRAGRAIFENVAWKPPVLIVCGTGNNAGDGYVLAGLLQDAGIACGVMLLEERFSEDGRYYFDICRERGINISLWTSGEDLKRYSTIVDCIFGTGFKGAVRGKAAEAIKAINESGAYIVCVDINSGLNGDSGMAGDLASATDRTGSGNCVRSDLTVSIGSYKPGHFLNMAKDVMKRKINCDIGIRPVDRPFRLLESSDLKPYFGPRCNYSNKGTYGYVALIGGSKRYSGAIRLAAMANAAMRSGAGVVKIAVADSLCPVVAANILESTLFPLSDDDGEVRFVESEIAELIRNVRTVAFGMGIGVTAQTAGILDYLLDYFTGRLIIDADGLTLFAKADRKRILNTRAQLVLTPHIKEFSRLLEGLYGGGEAAGCDIGSNQTEPKECEVSGNQTVEKDCGASSNQTDPKGFGINDILTDPTGYAVRYAGDISPSGNAVLLLKGPSTIITDGKEVCMTDTGCAGMATAGSRDVVSGILSAVCAYLPEDDPAFSVAAGAYINGKAGQLAQSRSNSISMTAGDTVSCIAEVITELAGE